ncbi:unnamed protein product [Prunus brigantina]
MLVSRLVGTPQASLRTTQTFNLVDPDDLELHKELIAGSESTNAISATNANLHGMIDTEGIFRCFACFGKVMEKDRLTAR